MGEQKKAVVHLTPSDPQCDSRVLKEMAVAKVFEDFSIYGIGRRDSSSKRHSLAPEFQFILLDEERFNRPKASFRQRAVRALKWRLGYLWSPFEFDFKLRKLLRARKISERVEIIHVHDYQALLAGVRLKKRTGARLIYDAHELESDTNGLRRRDSFLIRFGERLLWKQLDGFITVSESIRDHYFSRHPAVASEIVLNSPNPPKGWPRMNGFVTLRDRLAIHANEKLFVYLGYLSPGRGVELILEAFDDLPETYHVAFVGSGELEERIKASPGFGSTIHLCEPVDQELVVPFISRADAGFCLIEPVSLSDYFSLPNKLFECLFAGLPVIGSYLPEIEAMITRYDAGVLSSFDIKAIREATIQIANNDFQVNESAIEALSWDAQFRKVESLYFSLLEVSDTDPLTLENKDRH